MKKQIIIELEDANLYEIYCVNHKYDPQKRVTYFVVAPNFAHASRIAEERIKFYKVEEIHLVKESVMGEIIIDESST